MDSHYYDSFSSQSRMGDALGLNERPIRGIIKKLQDYGLINARPYNKGTELTITPKGRMALRFHAFGFADYCMIDELLKNAHLYLVLSIIEKMSPEEDES